MKFSARITVVFFTLFGITFGQWDPNVYSDRQAAVHLFEWKWSDVAAECERFLGPKGFGAIQVSPPHECVAVYQNGMRPWWERYQPVSYNLNSRSGDENAFKDMVSRCNNAGVRIYVDAVINHMSGGWSSGTPTTGGCSFDSGSQSYPCVPFSGFDFNDGKCSTSSGNIENYGDANQVRNCKLVGLNDLNQGSDYVRGKILEYMNRLISYGVAGFRIDASKHMWPGDLGAIAGQLSGLNSGFFPGGGRPFIYQEVIDLGGEPISGSEYTHIGRVTEFKYGKFLGEAFRGRNQLKYLKNFGEEWGMLSRGVSIVFIDNHDNQRGHGAGGDMILTFKQSRLYKMANAFMLAHPYGFTKLMSSYNWENTDEGPPHDSNFNINSPIINDDDTCGGGWICEHRWRQLYSMVQFRNAAHGTDMNDWWDNGNNQIAFCRGNKGFIAINNEGSDMNQNLQTCLPAGSYCDVISGSKSDRTCTGKTIVVGGDGRANIQILSSEDDGVLAIHEQSKI